MCLRLKFLPIRRKALRDIVCYKYVENLSNRDGYFTPFRFKQIFIGETYYSDLIKTAPRVVDVGLHSFKNYKDCYDNSSLSTICVKCIIPKGSYYYKGTFIGCKSYASTSLKYVEIVNYKQLWKIR